MFIGFHTKLFFLLLYITLKPIM